MALHPPLGPAVRDLGGRALPGKRLNDTERELLGWWQNGPAGPHPYLTQIQVEGDPGLRGIRELQIEFNYPITVVTGKNGSGKTTVLSLAALAFHTVPGHFPIDARRNPGPGEDSNYYMFSDFFYKGPGDPDITGVEINWEFSDHDSVSIQKETRKWMHYGRRPNRPVHYLGVQRAVPAVERSPLRSHFGRAGQETEEESLGDEWRQRFSDIMGRPYEGAQVINSPRYSIGKCTADTTYSSFNMGAGEDVLVLLLHLLEGTPEGALVVIEEMELGLHPEALRKLARHLQEIALDKNLQVITSSHSQYFIDALPRQGRKLLQSGDERHTVIDSPTTRFALGLMAGEANPELITYCEDNVAATLVKAALPALTKRRVQVVPVGGKNSIPRQAAHHLTADLGHRLLLVWDGDVTADEAEDLLEQGLHDTAHEPDDLPYTSLPGDGPPESWVVDQLDSDEGKTRLSARLKYPPDQIGDIVNKLKAEPNPHDIGHVLSEELNLDDEAEAMRILCQSVAGLTTDPMDPVVEEIHSALDD